ncbi:MAG: L,D-transpeptidase [Aeromicrobium sp.]
MPQPTHRARRSRAPRRLGVMVGVLVVSASTAVAAVAVAPQFTETSTSTVSSPSSLEQVSLPPVPDPVAKIKEAEPVDIEPVSVEESTALPAGSGSGRRIVFDQSDQRVWLVGDDGQVARTYAVSGSRFDNLQPGSYRVQSRNRHATAFDASGSMEYFVRFATGPNAAIGFHSVPVDNAGVLEQTKAQLGTPLSAGCVRQWKPDAIALWEFAPVGTAVVVTA